MLPNFLIAGVSRSGTTSLYYYMKQHPDIEFPELKEPRYFSVARLNLPQKGPGDYTVDKKLVKTWVDYEKLYSNIDSLFVGDASSEYLYHYESAIPEILERLGDVPIILMLRNPIDRSYSAYNNLVRDGRETLSFDEALKKEDARKEANFDEMWHYKSVSTYSESVRAFLDSFSNVKVLVFEEFIQDKTRYINEVFEFLGVKPIKNIDADTVYSKSGKPKAMIITILFGRNSYVGNLLRKTAFALFGRANIEKIGKHLMSENQGLSSSIRHELYEYFVDDIKELELILERSLDLWKKN